MSPPLLLLHPDERSWLDAYRAELRSSYPDAVTRMVLYGSRREGKPARRAILMCCCWSATKRPDSSGFCGGSDTG